ncbi:hypothetical protein TIFTF001_020316 [Ficus carica]|uniref:Uncharacterized protein n=1 Tax=Ficus carica TaxID=3494 RepID=A0AA88ARG6_FICCA|nr:hypothetical protein TIFTF001_020316 [Ficus carica]
MSNLKFLKVKCLNINLKFSQGLNSLPTALRYLEWYGYPFKSLPSEFSPRKFVEIHMPHSRLEKLWDGVQDLGNLKRIDLSFSRHLTQIPDLCRALKLERLSLKNCGSLVEVPDLSFSGHLTPILDDYFHQFCQFLKLNEIAFELREKQKPQRQPQPQPHGKRSKLEPLVCLARLRVLQSLLGLHAVDCSYSGLDMEGSDSGSGCSECNSLHNAPPCHKGSKRSSPFCILPDVSFHIWCTSGSQCYYPHFLDYSFSEGSSFVDPGP